MPIVSVFNFGGKIVEQGKQDNLINNDGKYYELVNVM